MLALLFFLWFPPSEPLALPAKTKLIREFELPSDPTLRPALPGAVDFGPDGRMYLLDQREARVCVYGPDGKFLKTFSAPNDNPAQNPNPMMSSVQLGIGGGEIWVWTRKQRMFVFDLEGNPLRHAKLDGPFPKTMGVLKKDLLLMSSGVFVEDSKNQFKVFLTDMNKGMLELMAFDNPMYLDRQTKPEKMTVRGYGPDLDIQRDEKGVWYFGFGEDTQLFTTDADGNINGQHELKLKRDKATPEEMAYIQKADFPVWSGQRVAVVDEETAIDFRDPKAYYTQFTVREGKGIFVLTATGGWLTDLYAPSARGTYQLVTLATGEVYGTGSFVFPAESNVLFRNGRIIAAVFTKDHYRIAEIAIDGFPSGPLPVQATVVPAPTPAPTTTSVPPTPAPAPAPQKAVPAKPKP